MKPDGTDRKAVASGRNAVPRWSPDGRFLSVTTSDSAFLVSVMNADGSGVRNLPRPDPTLSLVCGAWSPDDTLLACEGWDTIKPGREGVYTVRASDGGGLTRITTSTGGIHDIPGDFSPDGTQIAFVRATYAPAAIGQLWMASVDGSNTRKIADTLTSYGVSWSKDGRWIAGSANGRLLIFDLQDLGSPPRQISIAKGSAVGARWSPNGKALVLGFVRTGTVTREIYTVNADGTNPVPLTDPLHLDEYPDWGPSP